VIILILGLLLCAVAFVLVLDAILRPAASRRASLRRVATYAAVQTSAPRPQTFKRPGFLETVVPLLSRAALRLTLRSHADQLEGRLVGAGIRRVNAQQFLALKMVAGILGIVIGLALAGLTFGGFVLALALLATALFLPDAILLRLQRDRAQRLSAHLAQAIDQIAISLEAGLGFDAAVSYFVRRAKSPLVPEFRTMLSAVRMGESRTDALKGLAERVPSDDMRTFVQTLVQSEGVGISRAAILRNQAVDLRARRQLAAEERAQKAPIKMLFPIVIFILPVMFIVILGPAFEQASRLLKP
jgi:tight adherence protein C